MDTIHIDLNNGWLFKRGDEGTDIYPDPWYAGYDDSGWREVNLPHDWSIEEPFSEENMSGTGYLAGGIGWYRLHFSLPEEYRGKCVSIMFDGVYKNSRVWCNSTYLGERPNGYISFSYDLTPLLRFGSDEKNTLCVKVTHEDTADSRWFTGSGITRKVSLLVEEPVHPAPWGVFYMQDKITGISDDAVCADSAGFTVRHEIVNTTDRPQRVQVETCFYDEDGNCAGAVCGECAVPGRVTEDSWKTARHTEPFSLDLHGTVKNAHLWSHEHPYRYRIVTRYTVCDGSGSADEIDPGHDPSTKDPAAEDPGSYIVDETYIGIRQVLFDPDKGLFINGVNTKLKGVCVHHDGGSLGAAMHAQVWQRRLELLREAGCNAIRCSHNPHMPELYDLCDAMGFYMMDEAFDEWVNPKNKWWNGHNVYPPKHQGSYSFFPEWHERDLSDMVKRDRNHPSVLFYSIGNEIDYPNDPYCHPSFESMTGNNDANKPAAERRYDPDKPDMSLLSPIAAELTHIVQETDPTRPATIAAAFPELSTHLGFIDPLTVVGYNYKEHLYEESHRRFPGKTFLGSENGHSLSAWRAVIEHDYICGQFLWTGIDYLGEAGGWPVHGSPAGLITTAGLPKPEFYRRKRLWSADDTKALDALEKDPFTETECWRQDPKELLDPSLDTETGAVSVTATVWSGDDAITGLSFEEASAKNGYLYQVILRLVDGDGRTVRMEDTGITVTAEGAGVLVSLDNGDLSDNTPFTDNTRRTFRGELAAYIRRTTEGTITVKAGSAFGITEVTIG